MDKLFKKFLTYLYGSGLGVIIGFITTVLSVRLFTPEDYGKFSLYILVINMLMIIILIGTDQAFIRYFNTFSNFNRTNLTYKLIKAPLLLLVVVIIILIFLYKKLGVFIFGTPAFEGFILVVIGILTYILNRYILLIVRMQQKGLKYSFLEVGTRLLNLILIVCLYYFMGQNFKVMIYAILSSTLITMFYGFFTELNFFKSEKVKPTEVQLSQKEILRFSYPFMITILITWLFESIDKISLRYLSDLEELGLYAAAFKIVALLNIFKASFSTFWVPVSYERFEKGEDYLFFVKINEIVSFSMFILATILMIFKEYIIILLGTNYIETVNLFPFLIFIPLMFTMSEVTGGGINFYGKTFWHMAIAMIVCVVNIILNYLLVPILGALGAALSTGAVFILFYILRTHVSQIYFKVPYKLWKVYILTSLLFLYSYFETFMNLSPLNSYLFGILIIIIILIFYKNVLLNIFKKRSI